VSVQPYAPEALPPAGIDWESHIPQIASANRALAWTLDRGRGVAR